MEYAKDIMPPRPSPSRGMSSQDAAKMAATVLSQPVTAPPRPDAMAPPPGAAAPPTDGAPPPMMSAPPSQAPAGVNSGELGKPWGSQFPG